MFFLKTAKQYRFTIIISCPLVILVNKGLHIQEKQKIEEQEKEFKAAEERRLAEEERIKTEEASQKTKRNMQEKKAREQKEKADKKIFEETEQATIDKEIENCFILFELLTSATFEEVKNKRKLLIRLYHPDKHSTDVATQEYADRKTKEINYAYDILKTKHFNLR